MNLTPAQRRVIRRWTYRNQRDYRGMCERHNRERDEKGAS